MTTDEVYTLPTHQGAPSLEAALHAAPELASSANTVDVPSQPSSGDLSKHPNTADQQHELRSARQAINEATTDASSQGEYTWLPPRPEAVRAHVNTSETLAQSELNRAMGDAIRARVAFLIDRVRPNSLADPTPPSDWMSN